MSFYRWIVRPVLFRTDPEWVHDRSIRLAELAGTQPWLCARWRAALAVDDPRLRVRIAGREFSNPIGLAAGYDKSGRAIAAMAALGFGHVEIGSISAEPSRGNPKPRLFRISADQGIVVYYGLPNEGAERIGARLDRLECAVPVGVNLVNTNRGAGGPAESDEMIFDDYLRSLDRVRDAAGYICLNLSCPNTRDGRGFFADRARLRHLLAQIDARQLDKPLFLKVAPFANPAELESFLQAAEGSRSVSGFAVNLPPGKPAGLITSTTELAQMPGAVSGRPCRPAIDQTIADLYRRMDRSRFSLIAAGGVFTAEDAYRKIRLGASLVQVLTGMIYEGPGVVRAINRGLVRWLYRDGFRHVSEAVGVDALAGKS